MIPSALFAFLHFVAVFGIFGTLFCEWLTMSRTPTVQEAKRIQRCDMGYGLFAIMVLIVGFLRAYHFEKGAAYYHANPFYIAKLSLFAVIGLLSIYPTIRFIKWRDEVHRGLPPVVSESQFKIIMVLLRLELIAFLGMALCATLMARAVGM